MTDTPVTSSRGLYATGSGSPRTGPNELQPAADQSLGNSVGAIGWPANRPAHLHGCDSRRGSSAAGLSFASGRSC